MFYTPAACKMVYPEHLNRGRGGGSRARNSSVEWSEVGWLGCCFVVAKLFGASFSNHGDVGAGWRG